MPYLGNPRACCICGTALSKFISVDDVVHKGEPFHISNSIVWHSVPPFLAVAIVVEHSKHEETIKYYAAYCSEECLQNELNKNLLTKFLNAKLTKILVIKEDVFAHE